TAVRETKPEDQVRYHTDVHDLSVVRESHAEAEWVTSVALLLRKRGDDLVLLDEAHAASSIRRQLRGDSEVDRLKLVFDEGSAGFAILPSPLEIGKVDAAHFNEEADAAVGKCIDIVRRSCWKAIKLCAWPIDVPCVIKPGETLVGAIEGTAKK